jgi:hypothetical protein
VVVLTPLGLVLSVIGLVMDKNKTPAIMGLILGGIIAGLFLVLSLC